MLKFSSLQTSSSRLLHGVTQAHEGNFNDESPDFESTLNQFAQAHQFPIVPRYLKQMHSKTTHVETLHCNVSTTGQNRIKEGDALITNEPNVPLMVKTADCQGILLYAPDVHALGVVHSGWRGSVQNIVGETIFRMIEQYGCDPSQMQAAISPSLGPCCATFTDPKSELPEFCHPFIQSKQVDFWSLSLKQLEEAGVIRDHIEPAEHCTKCQPGYFSHRRGDVERFVTWGMLK